MSTFRVLTRAMSSQIKVQDSLDNLTTVLINCFEGVYKDYTAREHVQEALKAQIYPKHDLSLDVDTKGIPVVKSGDFKIYTYLSDDDHTLNVALTLSDKYYQSEYKGLYPRVRKFDKLLSTQYVSLYKYDMLAHEIEATIEEYLDVIMVANFKYNDYRFNEPDLTPEITAWSSKSDIGQTTLEFKNINAVKRRFSSSVSAYLDMRNLIIDRDSIIQAFNVFCIQINYRFKYKFSSFLDESVLNKFSNKIKIDATHFEVILGPYKVDILFEDKNVSVTKTVRSDIDMTRYGFHNVKQQYLIDMPAFDDIKTLDDLDMALEPLSNTISDLIDDAASYVNYPDNTIDDDIPFQ